MASARPPHFLADALAAPAQWGLRIERSGRWLARTIEIAGDSRTRKQGLLGRDRLEAGTALVIAPSQGVHTFGMRFPIDIVGVSRDGTVVKCRSEVGPRRLVFAFSAFAMLEVASGVGSEAGLEVGDRLTVARND